MKRPAGLRALALVLPVLGLAGAWGWTWVRSQQGTEWEVPVEASGPRASLRGRYVVFRYAWPLPPDTDVTAVQALCLEGTAPRLAAARPTGPDDRTCPSLARAAEGGTRFSGVQGGLLYIPQERVPAIRAQLADRARAPVVRIRVSDSGVITPLGLRFVGRGVEGAVSADR